MKYLFLILCVVALFIQACTTKHKKEIKEAFGFLAKEPKKSLPMEVVFVQPTELEVQCLIEEYGEEDYFSLSDDKSYHEYDIRQMLDILKIPYQMTEDRIVTFENSPDSITVDTDTLKELWTVLVYDGQTPPYEVSSLELAKELSEILQRNLEKVRKAELK